MSIEKVNQVMREGEWYSTDQIANEAGILRSAAREALVSLFSGMLIEREERTVGKTTTGFPRKEYFYRTKQRELNF